MNLAYVRRFWLAGVVLAVVLVLLPFSFHAEQHLETATRIEGSEATTVAQELSTRFHSPFVDRVVLVVQGLPPTPRREGKRYQRLKKDWERNRAFPELFPMSIFAIPIFLGKGGGTLF